MKQPAQHLPQLNIDQLNACVHCGLCLPVCATYRATGSEAESPRGRIYLMRKWTEGAFSEPDDIKPHLDQCLACHACETVCPSGVQYGDLLFQTREQLAQSDKSFKRKFKRFVFQFVLSNDGLLSLMRNALDVYQKSGLQWAVRKLNILSLAPAILAQEALLPKIPQHHALVSGMRFGDKSAPLVALMTGCVMDVFFNPIHWQTIFVLVKNAYQVLIPEQTCCGALAHHAGETDIARNLAKQNLPILGKLSPDWIVLNSAGCGSTMQHYDSLLPEEPGAAAFSQKVIDVMALLSRQELASFPDQQKARRIAYHAACHLYHVQKVQGEVPALLRKMPNTEIIALQDIELCCGSAGIYNLEYPELADEMLDNKLNAIEATLKDHPVDMLVSGNPGCLMQLSKGLNARGLDLKLRHPVEVLAEAYGYQGVEDVLAYLQPGGKL